MNQVKLLVGGIEHHGWSRVNIQKSIYNAAGTFKLTLSPVWESMPPEYTLDQGETCSVKIEDETLITGFIDCINPKVDSSNRTIEVSGRDKTGDIVDCPSLRQSRVWNSALLETIAIDLLRPFGIPFIHPRFTGQVFPTWGIQEESIFDSLSRAASFRGFLLISDGKGNLVATRPKVGPVSCVIDEGSGVLDQERIQDFRNRFSHYVTRGPSYGPTEGKEQNLRFSIPPVFDNEIKRYRPCLISQEGETREEIAQKRLLWEARVRRAKSDRINLTVKGWKNRQGLLWDINQLVRISLPAIQAFGSYLSTRIQFILDSGGTKTNLEFEAAHSADIDPTLEAREINFKKAFDQEAEGNL